jgi:hypothetical protein
MRQDSNGNLRRRIGCRWSERAGDDDVDTGNDEKHVALCRTDSGVVQRKLMSVRRVCSGLARRRR